jgi:L-ascorbate metabolism protein UlaG (beta-lactamase superfamily)
MNLQLIRNATMRFTYAGKTLLCDPMLSAKGAIRSFAGVAPNPTVDLPQPAERIVAGIDGVIVSHDHPDHFDAAAAETLPKTLPLFCQPGDEAAFFEAGFRDVLPVASARSWNEIAITRTAGRHGSGKILERMGPVSGFVFQAQGEPTVYWAGDSVWCEAVAEALAVFDPAIVILHAGGATIPGFDPIIMDARETLTVLDAAPKATVVAVHLEALDHCTVTRQALRKAAREANVPESRLRIPEDGETIDGL